MEIKGLFKKDITRELEGVVTIGNEEEKRKIQELDEYVCTEEVTKNLRQFFKAYRQSVQVPNSHCGVWITGFFGSGKSHFLKILGYLLSNETVGGKPAVEYFDEKIADPTIKGDIRMSASQENLVVLFNIDSKAKSNAKSSKDSIMDTMLNCFNEKIGYSGSIPWLAEFERTIDREGQYEEFQRVFEEISRKNWVKSRNQIFFLRDHFIATLQRVKGISAESARAYFDDCQKNFSINTETFGKMIEEYCREKKRRVVFLIDEVGQFIGTNSNLMLGLQTVVEDLGKYANGKAWVVVTSQQQIDALVEGSNRSAQLDFSKIQGRFATRLTMSSANADEVIKRRLLEKTPEAKNYLATIYQQERDRLNQLLIFPATPKWSGYRDEQQFVDDYPFVNYQYELLQKVFDSIRENGMTEGKSISSGERSLLSAFKKSAELKCAQEVGLLIPFNDFYSTAEEFMDYNIKQVFANALKRLGDTPFDIEVLKVLFMLKSVKEMEPTLERLSTLMVSDIHEDKAVLKKRIKESLDRLIAETFVQQNGERYEFLTNEEQDVNRRIKNSSFSQADVLNGIRQIIYDKIVDASRTYSYDSHYSFPLNRYIDDNNPSSPNPDAITVTVLTPWSKGGEDPIQTSIHRDGIVIDLTNAGFIEELVQANKILYFDRNNSSGASASLITILTKKRAEAEERRKRAEEMILAALRDADIYLNGSKLSIGGRDAKKRFDEAMKMAIISKFPRLDAVKEFAKSNEDISKALQAEPIQIGTLLEVDANHEAMDIIYSIVKDNKGRSTDTSIKWLCQKLGKPPYGYRSIDVRLMVAKMIVNSLLRGKYRGNVLSPRKDLFTLYRGSEDEYIKLEIQERIDERTLNQVRRIMKDAFEQVIEPKEKSLYDESVSFFNKRLESLREVRAQHPNQDYPGKPKVDMMIELFGHIIASDDPGTVFKRIIEAEDKLLDYGESLDSIVRFYQNDGPQMRTWKQAKDLVKYYKDNSMFIPELGQMADLIGKIEDILFNAEPFNLIAQLGELVTKAGEIKREINSAIKAQAEQEIEACLQQIESEASVALDKKFVKPETPEKIEAELAKMRNSFARYMTALENPNQIEQAKGAAHNDVRSFRATLSTILEQDKKIEPTSTEQGENPVTPPTPPRRVKRVRAIELVPVAEKTITSQDDIDSLISNIKKQLEELLRDNDEVKID